MYGHSQSRIATMEQTSRNLHTTVVANQGGSAMKTTAIILILCGVFFSERVIAQTNELLVQRTNSAATGVTPERDEFGGIAIDDQSADTATNSTAPSEPKIEEFPEFPGFPTEFTNRAGIVFRNIRVQQPSLDGIIVGYDNTNNRRVMDIIGLDELSPELQDFYGYDPKNPGAYREKERRRKESLWLASRQADQKAREAQQRKMDVEREAARKRFESVKAEAEKGDPDFQYELGYCFYDGKGVTKNPGESVRWFRLAAEQDHVGAQNDLGVRYLGGWGIAKDLSEAAKWLRKAAEQGDAGAQFNLGNMYVEGKGVAKDFVAAYKWLNLAVAGAEDERFRKYYLAGRSEVEAQMYPSQIAEAQRLAREFRPRRLSKNSDSRKNRGAGAQASGTGFFVSEDGFLVTNEHVVRDAAEVRLVTGAGLISAIVVKLDAVNDLALLKATGRFTPLPITASRAVSLGGTVITVGFPNINLQGFAPKLAKGEIAALSGASDDPRYFQVSVPVQPGNSGGALVDERGNVVGVVAAKLSARVALAESGALPENVNYAVKSSLLLSFLESVPEVSASLKKPTAKERKFEDVVNSAKHAAVLVLVY